MSVTFGLTICVLFLIYTPNPHLYTTIFVCCLPLFRKHMCPGPHILSPVYGKGESVWDAQMMGEYFTRVCTQNYSDAQFNARIQGLISGLSLVPGSSGKWVDDLYRSCESMTSWPQLWYSLWNIHVRTKAVTQVFPP